MDTILSKEIMKKENLYKDNVLEGPRCEDIKQEVEDIDINDDMESYSTVSNQGSDYGDEISPLPSLTPAPNKEEKTPKNIQSNNLSTIVPGMTNFAIPIQTQQVTSPQNPGIPRTNGMPSLPFPLLIVQQKPQINNNDKKTPTKMPNIGTIQAVPQQNNLSGEIGTLLKEILDIQKENLSIEKERLGLEKERLEYHKSVGDQLLTLVPIFGSLLQKIAYPSGESINSETPSQKNGKKRKSSNEDISRESKILRTVLEKNIKKYMLEDDYLEESGKDDSGIGITKDDGHKKKK
ncbi:hypothetical protein HHI36_014170 [Cryptolaemus montrouzieri]